MDTYKGDKSWEKQTYIWIELEVAYELFKFG